MTRDRSAVIAATGTPAHRSADPTGEVREFMLTAWGELLGCANLTEHSDFFARGGDSLLMTRLVRRIAQEFGVTVPLHEMSRRNLGDQAALVHQLRSRARSRGGVRNVRQFLTGEWVELLGCSGRLTERSDFFALGGDSLLVTRLVHRVGREFGATPAVHDMLAAPTLGAQVRLVSGFLTAAPRLTPTLRGRAA